MTPLLYLPDIHVVQQISGLGSPVLPPTDRSYIGIHLHGTLQLSIDANVDLR